MTVIKPGLYQHNKGQLYKVLTVARSVKDREPRVVFQELIGDYETWLLPLTEWNKRFTPYAPKSAEIYLNKIGLILIHNGKLLMVRPKGRNVFLFPGGPREAGENDAQCLVRKVKQELGIETDIASIQYYGTFTAQAHGQAPGVLAKLTCYMANCKGKIRATNSIDEFAWFGYKQRNHVTPVAKLVFDELYYKGLIGE